MNKTHIIVFALAITSLKINAQTTSDSHQFVIPKKATLLLNPSYDTWSPALKNHELPIPESGIDEKTKKQIKEDLTKRYPRKNSQNNSDKTTMGAPPAMLRNFLANSFNGFVPNDNDVAVSNNGTVCSVTNVNIWTKNLNTNITYGSYSLHSIMLSLGLQNEEFDPKVIYDPETNRFVLVCLNGFTDSTSHIVIGFSQTDSSNGAWNFYSLPGNPLNNTLWTDFPMISLSHNELFLTVNLLYNDSSWQTGFNETLIWQMNKQNGYDGNPLNAQLHNNILHNGAPLRNLCPVKGGSQLYGPQMHFLSNRNFAASNDTIFLVTISDTAAAPGQTLTVIYAVGNTAYHMPVDAIQPSSDKLAVNDARVLGAFEENGKIQFVLNTLDTATGNDAIFHGLMSNISTTPTLITSILGDPVMDLAYPNIAYAGTTANSDSSIISIQQSAVSVYPGSSAALFDGSQFSSLTTVKTGVSYINLLGTLERWGDYTGCQTKYNQPGYVWMNGAYALAGHNTRTWIAELTSSTSASVEDISNNENNAVLYPNPSANRITIEFSNTENQRIDIKVFDVNGKIVKQLFGGFVSIGPNEFSFATNELSKGNYFVKISGNNSGIIATKKFIKD